MCQSGFGKHAGLFHCPRRAYAFFPCFFGAFSYLQLCIEHQQRVVVVGYGRDELGFYGLFVILALFEQGFGLPFGIGNTSEQVYFP